MARLILFVCSVVALSSMVFAAPLAEEETNAQQFIEDIDALLKNADPEENDIGKPVEATDSTVEALTTPSAVDDDPPAVVADEKELNQTVTEEDVVDQVTTNSTLLPDVVAPSDEPNGENEFPETVEQLIEEYGELNEEVLQESEIQGEKVVDVTDDSFNVMQPTDSAATEQGDMLTPVTEIIPPPKKAFVLGEYADEQVMPEPATENNDEYKIVLGETEDGTPFLSEYQPNIEEEFNGDVPIVGESNYEYPEEAILPGAEYRPQQGPLADHSDVMYDDSAMSDSGNGVDYNYDYEMTHLGSHPNEEDYITEGDGSSDFMYHDIPDYQTEPHIDDSLDYGDDFTMMPFNESPDYDVGASHTGEDPMMHEGIPSSMLPMHDDLKATLATQLSNLPDAIVAGLHENYHPEPIPGIIPFPSDFTEDIQGSNSPSDFPIMPSAMVNFDTPAVENTRHQDDMMETPMPDIPSMIDLPRPVAEFAVGNQPMASMQPLDSESMPFMENNGMEDNDGFPGLYDLAELDGQPMQQTNEDDMSGSDFDTESQPDIVIEVDIATQQALVNGKPFTMKRPTSILGFIGQILESSGMRSRNPSASGYSPERNPFYYYKAEVMNYPERNQYASSYTYPSSYDEDSHPDQHQQSSFSYDYPPFNPFLSDLRRRMLQARFNKMRSFDTGYGYNYTPMSRYNSIRGYDDSMQGYNPMQEYDSFRGYDDSMSRYNARQGYGPDYYNQYW